MPTLSDINIAIPVLFCLHDKTFSVLLFSTYLYISLCLKCVLTFYTFVLFFYLVLESLFFRVFRLFTFGIITDIVGFKFIILLSFLPVFSVFLYLLLSLPSFDSGKYCWPLSNVGINGANPYTVENPHRTSESPKT